VPDLEAVATVQLTDTNTNTVVGCVQATLSNGHTARQSGAKWATVGLALFALFASLLHSFIAQSVGAAQWRVVDVMLAIQHPAVVSLLSLNYPIVYIQYALNFAWSLGLVNIAPLQRSITATRARAGDLSGGIFGEELIAQVGRQTTVFGTDGGSTSGVGVSGGGLLSGLSARSLAERAITYLKPLSSHAELVGSRLARRQQYAPNTGPGGAMATSDDTTALPIITGESDHTSDIGTFAQYRNIAPGNVFLTVLTSIGILLGIVLAALLLAFLIALAVRFFTRKNSTTRAGHWSRRVTRPREFLGVLLPAFLSRFWLVTFPVLTLFAFYQWYFGAAWPAHLVAGLSFGLFLLVGAAFLVPMLLHSRRAGSDSLYYGKGNSPELGSTAAKRWGHMAHPYRPTFFYFAFIFVLWSIIRACWIVFAQGHGFRQAVGLLVFEFVFFVLLLVFRPGRDKKSDWVYVVLTFCRMASFGVAVAFTEQAGLDPLPRVIVGFVMLVVTALPIIFTFFMGASSAGALQCSLADPPSSPVGPHLCAPAVEAPARTARKREGRVPVRPGGGGKPRLAHLRPRRGVVCQLARRRAAGTRALTTSTPLPATYLPASLHDHLLLPS
jgi:hypothetical protein